MQKEFSLERKPSGVIAEAIFRPATIEEKRSAQGGIVWKVVTAPWKVTCAVLGTFELYMSSANSIGWERPAVQAWVEKISYWLGYNPEEVFMKTIRTYFLGNRHLLEGNEVVFDAFFKHHRNEELFKSSLSMKKILEIIQIIFPEEKFGEDDFMMTCSPKMTQVYRTLLRKSLSGERFNKFISEKLFPMVQDTLKEWGRRSDEGEEINVTLEARLFTSRVITQLMFGEGIISEEIAKAVDFINYYIIKSVLRKLTKEDKEGFEKSTRVFKEAVDEILQKEEIPLFSVKQKKEDELSLKQKKSLIFLIFFAGQETTASLLTWIIRILSLDADLQDSLYEEIRNGGTPSPETAEKLEVLKELFNLAIADFTPAYGVGRLLKTDACLEYRLEGEKEFRKKIFSEGEIVVARIYKLARSISETEESLPEYDKWSPFGGGPHTCPGEKLAYKEIILFLMELAKYKISTEQLEDIPKIGHVTLKLESDVTIRLSPRELSE